LATSEFGWVLRRIYCRGQALQKMANKSTGFVAAARVLRLLEKEQANIIEELGYNPRTN